MSRTLGLTLVAALALPALAARADDVLVIAPETLHAGLGDWRNHREAQGTTVHIAAASPETSAEAITALVRQTHRSLEDGLTHVLLLGDVDSVPCAYRPAVAIARWEKDSRIATDAPFADVDDDGLPDLAIGRIPAATADEARAILARSIAYEKRPPAGDWRRRLGIVAGVGGFGGPQDMALEMLTRLILNQDVPEFVDARFTFAKESSPFCPAPADLQGAFVDQLSSGALVVAYVGHGSARHVDRMDWREREWPILEAAAVPRVRCDSGAPLVAFIACSTGKYDADEDSLAELLIRQPSGPAAVLASSRVSTPYGNAIFAIEMLDVLHSTEPATVGEIVCDAKRRMRAGTGTGTGDLPTRRTIDAMAGSFYEPDAEKRAADRREHMLLYQLFGDPLLRLARPERAQVMAPASAEAGATAQIVVKAPFAGTARVELVPRRDANARPRPSGRSADTLRRDYRESRLRPIAIAEIALERAGSSVTVDLAIPADAATRPHHVRVIVTDDGLRCATAGTTLRVTPAGH